MTLKLFFKRIVIFAVLRPVKAVSHPMVIFVILLNVAWMAIIIRLGTKIGHFLFSEVSGANLFTKLGKLRELNLLLPEMA